MDLNREYSISQEDLTMSKAELDNLRRESRETKVITTTNTRLSVNKTNVFNNLQ